MFIPGDLWQLPPIMDRIVLDKSRLDGRPDCSVSHWNQYFRIFYLTEKMRSNKDAYFSDLCDRVGRGNITEDDEKYLHSRVRENPSENFNENFKNGKVLIVVTTNPKKDQVNNHKLSTLLPLEKEYSCNSTDRVTNLPLSSKLPERLNENPGKTGNLQTLLKLKVNAPVVITKNHSKRKYREDGIVNGARGFVQSIQVCKQNTEKVDIIWVRFNNKNVGRLYRFENNHLRKEFNPGDDLATPILPTRSNFKIRFGNVEYQRQNFPLSLAYAVTAHKCQGETLEEVIIDFGPDKQNNISNYIVSGSFYVALTRVREGSKIFLKSFDKSYVQVNKNIEDKINAMIKYRSYNFKKIYLDEKIFEVDSSEIKVGYLNINGLRDAGHGQYLDADRNLSYLDILVLAESKLNSECDDKTIDDCLSNWSVRGRFDSKDKRKHMGLLLLISKKSKFLNQIQTVSYKFSKRNDCLQIQGLIVKLTNGLRFGFLYCRSSPTDSEVKAINQIFFDCDILMGDFNLSHRIPSDREKLNMLCQESKISALKEITRSISNNQLDYILIDKQLTSFCSVCSFHNFISDHKSITVRVGLNKNKITDEIKAKITFDRELHQKSKRASDTIEDIEMMSTSTEESNSSVYDDTSDSNEESGTTQFVVSSKEHSRKENEISVQTFKRKFKNVDMATCWLNSCLQLFLTALDHINNPLMLNSELGNELIRLKNSSSSVALDPAGVKNLIVSTEDIRIATRLSEIAANIPDQQMREHLTRAAEESRHDLISGQQCVRDFFLCLEANLVNWPDVCSVFSFKMTHSLECLGCNRMNKHNTEQMFIEIDVPPDNSNLSEYVEDYLNISSLVCIFCKDVCQKLCQKEKRTRLTLSSEAEFIVIILTRTVDTMDGKKLIRNKVNSTNDVFIR